jgi:hypothetical protein
MEDEMRDGTSGDDPQVKPFDPTKPVSTRDGRAARIRLTDAAGPCPILVEVRYPDGEWDACFRYADGRCSQYHDGPGDLINIKTKRKVWVNVYESDAYRSKEEATQFADASRFFQTVEVEIEE